MAVSQKQDENRLAYILCYIVTWISGLAIYLTLGQKDRKLKFHAVQAMFLGFAIMVLWALAHLPLLSWLNLVGIVFWLGGIYVGWEASQGNDVNMPFIAKYAKEYS
ncbi:MAG: hypothetical protein KGI00_01835 [Candidatus Micrarchaeota archaeon]|nr:hypothetical protein [Candidatus Micrarchaeota archaeon]MDE1823861.1 hypothetical protein [Candidatus Micrarchaeota archaeon]MDE1849449.1 hypothetical protein [Candidatus Micrarchaeota archaeon]